MVINTGKSNCQMLQMCLREMAYGAAINQSSENRLAEHLSRRNLSESLSAAVCFSCKMAYN